MAPYPKYVPPEKELIPQDFVPEPSGCSKLMPLFLLIIGLSIGAGVASMVTVSQAAPPATATATVTATPTSTPTATPSPTSTRFIVQQAGKPPNLPPTATVTPIAVTATCLGYHTVLLGQTLSYIAAEWWVSIDAIVSENKIRNPNIITPGTRLAIPNRCPERLTRTPIPGGGR